MALVLRTVENRPLTWQEGDDNLLYLSNSIVDVSTALPTPGGVDGELQYNDNGTFAGVPDLTYNSGLLQATGSFTGSFIGSLEGTASYATTAENLILGTTSGEFLYDNNGTISSTADLSYTSGLQATGSFQGTLDGTATTASYVQLVAGPGILVDGLAITASVRSVNGTFPVNGNISTPLVQTVTGTSASFVSSGSGAITASLADGLTWIISGDANPSYNGDVYIYNSGSVGAWFPVAPLDTAAGDARYLKLDGANGPMAGNVDFGSYDITNVGTITATSFAGTASWAVSASWAPATAAFPFTGSARITGSLTVTGSTTVTENTYANQFSYASAFQPYSTLGLAPIKPINPNTTASAAPSWWGSFTGVGSSSGGPGRVFFSDQNIGQIGLNDANTSNPWAGAIKLIRDTIATDTNTGVVPYHTLITNNATYIDSAANITVTQANNRTHVLTVAGDTLVRGGASLGTNISNSHIISGSVRMTGSFTVNGAAYVPSLLALTGSSLYTTNTSNVSPDQAIYIGTGSGEGTTGGYSVMVGYEAGKNYGVGAGAVILGWKAGSNMNNAGGDQVIIGSNAGAFAGGNTGGSIFIGNAAGYFATNANNSLMIGRTAGYLASGADYCVFLGEEAGQYQVNGNRNTLIGYQAGKVGSGGLAAGNDNIVIGTSVTLPAGQSNTLNIGGVLFARGLYNTPSTPFSGSIQSGRVGIATLNPNYTLDVSGSMGVSGPVAVTNLFQGDNTTTIQNLTAGNLTAASDTFAGSNANRILPLGYSSYDIYFNESYNNNSFLRIQTAAGGTASYTGPITIAAQYNSTPTTIRYGTSAGSNIATINSLEWVTITGKNNVWTVLNRGRVGETVVSNGAVGATQSITGSLRVLGTVTATSFVGSVVTAITSSGTTIYSTSPATSGFSTNNGIFLGSAAGGAAASANSSVFLGRSAGSGSNGAANSTFIGTFAGRLAINAAYSNFLGQSAGEGATSANYSNFLGYGAGYLAGDAFYSNFLGNNAGYRALYAGNSTLIGYQAGANTLITNGIGPNNIIIGTNITLPDDVTNSMNIGGVLFGTGFQSDTVAADPYPTPVAGGKIGIGTSTPVYTLDVAGSGNFTNNLTVSGSFITTGSLSVIGTATVTSASVQGTVVTNIGDTFTGTAAVTKIVSLTAAEYSGLGSTDANTLYIVI